MYLHQQSSYVIGTVAAMSYLAVLNLKSIILILSGKDVSVKV